MIRSSKIINTIIKRVTDIEVFCGPIRLSFIAFLYVLYSL